MVCPICRIETDPFLEVFDDRYAYPGRFTLLKCKSCGHLHIDKLFSNQELTNMYSRYYPRSKLDVSQSIAPPKKNRFLLWLDGDCSSVCRWVPEKVKVLDIGCGFGGSLAYHKSRGCDVYGVEADENIQRVVDEYGFNVHVGPFNADIYESDFFDYVTMDQVFEHMVNPIATLDGVAKILKQGGRLLLAVPNPQGWGAKFFAERWVNWHAPYHLHHYTVSSMTAFAEKAGFHIEHTKTITNSKWLYFQWQHLATYPAVNEKSDFWTGKSFKDYSILKKLLLVIAWIFQKLRINHLVTRVFDFLGIGDSRLFFLSKKIAKNG